MPIWSSFVGFLEEALLWFSMLTGSMGLGIILFTIVARLTILPLTLSSIRSSRRMQELQPKFKELQRHYGKDPQRLNEETMKLYKEHKVNPVGGCLPMLFQLPIFFGVYQAVFHLMVPEQRGSLGEAMYAAVEQGDVSLLLGQPVLGNLWRMVGLNEAAQITTLLNMPFLGLDLGLAAFPNNFGSFSGFEYLILPVLSVVLQLLQQLMAMPRIQDPQQKMMTQMMLLMPIMFGYVALIFPIGAVLYWVTSSVIGVIQQFVISGLGSLPNYLTFLPVIERWTPPTAEPELAAVGAGGAAALAAPRQGFWDVMRPLTEGQVNTPTTSSSASDANEPTGDTASTDQQQAEAAAVAAVRKQQHQAAARRSRRRR